MFLNNSKKLDSTFLCKRNIIFFSLVLISLAVIFSSSIGHASAACGSTIYVNGTGGSDSNNGYSWSTAKKTIKNATATVTAGGTVNIAKGTYTGTSNTGIVIPKSMNIKGASLYNTIIDAKSTNRIFTLSSGVKVTIQNLTLKNGKSSMGGAIYNYKGTLTLGSCQFVSNKASLGGAIYSSDGILNLRTCKFTSNSARTGGAIENYHENLTIASSSFISNTASWGGAIYNDGTLTLSKTYFKSNIAKSDGGAIYNNGTLKISILKVIGCNFTGNIAGDGCGGAIDDEGNLYGNGNLTVTNSSFTSNVAVDGNGGAIYSWSTLNVTGSIFTSNITKVRTTSVYSRGGAICNYGSNTMIVYICKFTSNISSGVNGGGGAIYKDGNLIVSNNTFIKNKANKGKGGAICYTGKIKLISNKFSGNTT